MYNVSQPSTNHQFFFGLKPGKYLVVHVWQIFMCDPGSAKHHTALTFRKRQRCMEVFRILMQVIYRTTLKAARQP